MIFLPHFARAQYFAVAKYPGAGTDRRTGERRRAGGRDTHNLIMYWGKWRMHIKDNGAGVAGRQCSQGRKKSRFSCPSFRGGPSGAGAKNRAPTAWWPLFSCSPVFSSMSFCLLLLGAGLAIFFCNCLMSSDFLVNLSPERFWNINHEKILIYHGRK